MWDIMGNICKGAQNNLWGLYGKYLWGLNMGGNMGKYLGNMWEVCRKYLCGPQIVYGFIWVF